METQTRLSRHSKFISAENIIAILSVYIYIYIFFFSVCMCVSFFGKKYDKMKKQQLVKINK